MTVDRGYFDLAKQLLITIGQIATTVLYFNLLLHYFRGGKKYEKLRNLPGIILLYFGYHALFSLAACPYAIYDASTLILGKFLHIFRRHNGQKEVCGIFLDFSPEAFL